MSASDPTVGPATPPERAAIEAWARALGFGLACDLFPDDVVAAARSAAARRAALAAPDDPACEPWLPMRPAAP